jgi:uncharacterized protein
MNRRRFLKRAAGVAIGTPCALGGYALVEARWCRIVRVQLPLPGLARAFSGTTVAFVSDTHHGPYVPRAYIRQVVELTNALRPDIIALGGDYVSKDPIFIAPGIHELGRLDAPLGRYAVLGNHDHWQGADETREALARSRIRDLTNDGVWIERGNSRLRVCGVDDLWAGYPDLSMALGDAAVGDATLLLSHNPDYAETIGDPRVGLVLSGHTHGGQVVLPFCGVSWAPTKYGAKYLGGLAQAPLCRVFVSRGAGTSGPPIRFACRPEIILITLTTEREGAPSLAS